MRLGIPLLLIGVVGLYYAFAGDGTQLRIIIEFTKLVNVSDVTCSASAAIIGLILTLGSWRPKKE